MNGGAILGAMNPAIRAVVGKLDEWVLRLAGTPGTAIPRPSAAAALSSRRPGTSAETKLTKKAKLPRCVGDVAARAFLNGLQLADAG